MRNFATFFILKTTVALKSHKDIFMSTYALQLCLSPLFPTHRFRRPEADDAAGAAAAQMTAPSVRPMPTFSPSLRSVLSTADPQVAG
ncbi:hypothetical protein NKI95_30985, partial [Mesorhizobium sp. M0306]|uniref:hypothetical protein n=1 Tax=Mesorhizobium sp. M0306 TaxID=2956932 RepID=UPI00333590E7